MAVKFSGQEITTFFNLSKFSVFLNPFKVLNIAYQFIIQCIFDCFLDKYDSSCEYGLCLSMRLYVKMR